MQLVILLERTPAVWTVAVSGIAGMVCDLPENFEKWKKKEATRLHDMAKRETARTDAVRVLLLMQSEREAANKKRQSEETTSRENLCRKFDSLLPTRTLQGIGEGQEGLKKAALEGRAGGGASFCEHSRIRSTCKQCGGAGICEHSLRRSECMQCGGAGSRCHRDRSRR